MGARSKDSALLLAATIAIAALSTTADAGWRHNNCAWNAAFASSDGPVFDGPAPGGPYYTGPYRGPFARLADPQEATCLMECRVRPSSWGGWQYYTVRVCRGEHVAAIRSSARRVRVELK